MWFVVDTSGCNAYIVGMIASHQASLNIRQLEPGLKERLRLRAAHHGRSMEAEARAILREALTGAEQPESGSVLAEAIRRRFEPVGGVELELPPRTEGRAPPRFG